MMTKSLKEIDRATPAPLSLGWSLQNTQHPNLSLTPRVARKTLLRPEQRVKYQLKHYDSNVPGRVCVSLTHCPGRGSGTLDDNTGSQAELDEACSLNLPKKAV
jgi:hypothetical protein